jgi:CRP-like cAMP-binding protein
VPEVGDANSRKSFTDDTLAFDLDMTERKEPKMSLDRAAVKEKKNIKRNRTKPLDRRGRQKGGHSALIKQKNKDKNAVFASVVVTQDDVSVGVLPEFMKDSTDKKIIVTALRKNFVFEDMDNKEIDKLVAAMEEVQFAAGKDIITQGEEGDYFYVVARGAVAFFIDGEKIGNAGPGNAFGELALLYTCPRSATVRALERTTLFRTDQKVFTIMTQSETKKSEEEKRELLRKIPFLSSLGADDINRLASLMGPVLFSTGDYIVRKGDKGSSFFIIRNGKARVTEVFVGGTSYEDISLEEGDYFGEDALVSDEPRAANVVALTKGSAFAIERDSVWKVLGDFGSLISKTQDRKKLVSGRNIWCAFRWPSCLLKTKIRGSHIQESMKIFRDADLSSADFDNLAKRVTDKAFAKGETICRRKEMVGAALYIVREGAVKITPKDKKATEIIKCGGAFGQDQILAMAPTDDSQFVSTYTAKVLEDCVCGVLTLDDCRTTFDTSALGDRIFSEGNFTLEKKRAAMRQLIQANIKYEDLEKDRIIGTGQFGTVWLVRADPHKTKKKSMMLEFALKVQFKEDPVRRQGALDAIKREMTVLRQLNHPFIIDLVDTYETGDQLMMLTEPVKGGELWSRIHREDQDGNWTSGMPEKNAKFYALVIADVVSFMHRQHIIFRDLKPENVLIDEEGYPALCDFGFAKYCPSDETATFCGTPNYLAPEIVLNRGHGAAVDHWALGVVTYEMITGENPFYYEGQDQMALLQAIVQEDFYPPPGTASKEVVHLISGLLEKEPVQRLGSLAGGEKGILKHPWFSELDINQIRNKKAKAPDIPIITS